MQKAFIKNLLDQVEKEHPKNEKDVSEAERKRLRIGGIEVTSDQLYELKNGGYIFLENMDDGDGNKYSSFVFAAPDMSRGFISCQKPDEFVRYGDYDMRIMDIMRIQAGFLVQAKVKWWGGIDYQYPFIWKENHKDESYQISWINPKKHEDIENMSNELPKKNRGRRI